MREFTFIYLAIQQNETFVKGHVKVNLLVLRNMLILVFVFETKLFVSFHNVYEFCVKIKVVIGVDEPSNKSIILIVTEVWQTN